jgi:hypothetical protein
MLSASSCPARLEPPVWQASGNRCKAKDRHVEENTGTPELTFREPAIDHDGDIC